MTARFILQSFGASYNPSSLAALAKLITSKDILANYSLADSVLFVNTDYFKFLSFKLRSSHELVGNAIASNDYSSYYGVWLGSDTDRYTDTHSRDRDLWQCI